MELLCDNLNVLLSGLGCIGGVAAAVIGWLYVRPADKKLKAVESELRRNNESISSMRNALLGSSVRQQEVKFDFLIKSCEEVYQAFLKIYSASYGLLSICASLKDLDEIRNALLQTNQLDRLREWLGLFVKDEMLVPIKFDHVYMAEIHVPERVWKLFVAAQTLYAATILKMTMLKNGMDIQNLVRKNIYDCIDELIPGQKKVLSEFGTTGYQSSMNLIQTALLNEIRKTLKNPPISTFDIVQINRQFEEACQIPDTPADIGKVVLKSEG